MSRDEFDARIAKTLWFRERGYTVKRAAYLCGLGEQPVAALWRMMTLREMEQ
jgi:hypothetical protein